MYVRDKPIEESTNDENTRQAANLDGSLSVCQTTV